MNLKGKRRAIDMPAGGFVPDRRVLLKWMAALPWLGYFAAQDVWAKAQKAAKLSFTDNIYTRIGVRPIVNARGTWTFLSGSLELPEVRAAMQEAAGHFVDMFELQRGAGKRLAELSGFESGMVTAGAAAAMATATAACIAGTDPDRIWQLPDTTELKGEVMMLGGRSAFDSAIRAAGGKLVLVRTPEDLKAAINEKTAMVYSTDTGERLERALAVTKQAGVPMLVDWAANIPPFENLSLAAKLGIDLFTVSGGKGLCGPQCAGLLLGRKDLIEAALANSSPWEGAVCRPMKVGKEEIMGMLAAVEAWKHKDLPSLNREWNGRVERIARIVETVPGVKTKIEIPTDGNSYPTLTVTWDEAAFKLPVADCVAKLREGEPRIEVMSSSNPSLVLHREARAADPKTPRGELPNLLQIVSMTLQPGEDLIVGKRLREVLNEARKNA
jgi:L-seryl-tRNA(Ser) seleniumtransferase